MNQSDFLSGKTRRLIGLALVAGLAVPGRALAGGIGAYEIGTADVGLASAGYGARAQDASTIWTNPAGMTRLEGTQILLGPQLLYGNLSFTIGPWKSGALGTNNGGNPVGWFPSGGTYFTYSISKDLKLGFGAGGTFGLGEAYDAGWVGRYYNQSATLLGISLLPSIAYRVSSQFSVGLTANVMYGVLKEQVALNNRGTAPDGELKLDSNAWGAGVVLGVLYELSNDTRFGLTYNSRVKLGFSAPAQFSGLSSGLSALLGAAGLLNSTISFDTLVPQGFMLGAFHQLNPVFAIMGNFGWQQWSKFGTPTIGLEDASNPHGLTVDLHFNDTWHGAVGTQVRLSESALLNFGVAYDSAFQDTSNVSPMLPVAAAWRVGLGVETQFSKSFGCGFAAEYLFGGTLNVNEQSTLSVQAGGRGNLVGSYDNTGILFLTAHLEWKL
jgi:long-chain fatty acid transport protein